MNLSFLDPTNNYNACIQSIEESIIKVVKDNPNITTEQVYQKECERLRRSGRTIESIRSEFTKVLGNLLGNENIIKANGTRTHKGKESVQLIIFKS